MNAIQLECQKLLDEYQTAFEEKHKELKTLLLPYARQAVLTFDGRRWPRLTRRYHLIFLDDAVTHSETGQPVNTPTPILMNGDKFSVAAYDPHFKKGGSRSDFITLTCWLDDEDRNLYFEFDAVVRFLLDEKTIQDVVLGARLRWGSDKFYFRL